MSQKQVHYHTYIILDGSEPDEEQMKNKNPKIYILYNIVMAHLKGLRYYIEHINHNKAIEVARLSHEAVMI